ncbi:MAG: efflux RND transporter periplasmic adaptor subunit [Candidatus Acidiferrales bacterium]|jgi:HlyD family secretion protein
MAEQKSRKWIVWVVVAVLAFAALISLTTHRQAAPVVPVAAVTRDNLISSISSNGKVEPVAPTIAYAQFPTFVSEVKATEGQPVKKGQLILVLDSADVRSQLSQARADLITAESDLKNATGGGPPDEIAQLQGDLAKAQTQVATLTKKQQDLQDLLAKKAATETEVADNDAALANARTTVATIQQKQQALATRSSVNREASVLHVTQSRDTIAALEQKIRSATVIAPSDGTLYSLPVRKGDYVKVGDTLAAMADLSHVRVRAFIDEPDLGSLAENQAVQVTWDALPDKVWSGKVEQVPKQVVPRNSRSVGEVLCSVDNSKMQLLPNVNVEVRIVIHDVRDAVAVPRAAVRSLKGQRFVFLYDGAAVHRRDIQVGVASSANYQVLSGLQVGDRVAEPPTGVELEDGMKIRATEAK